MTFNRIYKSDWLKGADFQSATPASALFGLKILIIKIKNEEFKL